MRTPKDEQPKAAAAKRGCLTARHSWQDLRQATRLARSEGVTLIVHGVTVSPHCKENLQCSDNMTETTGLDERGQQQTEAVGRTCEHSSKRQHDQQQQTKQQREDQRSLLRLRAFQQAVACGARWLPLMQKLLRRNRATSRDNVWTSHMRRTLALRDKMRDFLGRVLCAASSHNNTWTQVQKSPASPSGALGEGMLRQLAQRLRVRCNIKAAHMVMMPVYTRNFLSTYVQEHNVAAAHAMLRLQDLRNLFMNYKVAWNQEAAMASIIPYRREQPVSSHTLRLPPREARRETR